MPDLPQPFHPGDCAVISTINSGKLLRKQPTPGSFEYIRSRTWIEELIGPEFVTEMAHVNAHTAKRYSLKASRRVRTSTLRSSGIFLPAKHTISLYSLTC